MMENVNHGNENILIWDQIFFELTEYNDICSNPMTTTLEVTSQSLDNYDLLENIDMNIKIFMNNLMFCFYINDTTFTFKYPSH